MRGWMTAMVVAGGLLGCAPPEGVRGLDGAEREAAEALVEGWEALYGPSRCGDVWSGVGVVTLSPEAFTAQTGWCADRECGAELGYYWSGGTAYHFAGWTAVIMLVEGEGDNPEALEHELLHVLLRCEVGGDPNHEHEAWDAMGVYLYRP